jgi:hypothetical protein
MNFTKHGLQRWQERFPSLDPRNEYATTVVAKKAHLKRIAEFCPHQRNLLLGKQRRYEYRISENNIVFVIGFDESIITVFRFIPKCSI